MSDEIVADEVAWRAMEIERERKASNKFDQLARKLARSVAEYPYLWHWGDGCGGHVLRTIDIALAEQGFMSNTDDRYEPPTRVQRLAERDGWLCHYCDAMLGYGHPSMRHPIVEHVIPKAQGGGNALANLVLSCGQCNTAKAARTPLEWLGHYCCEVHR